MSSHIHRILLLFLILSVVQSFLAYQRIPSKTTTNHRHSTTSPASSLHTQSQYSHSTLYHIKPYKIHNSYLDPSPDRRSKENRRRIQLYQRIFHSYRTTSTALALSSSPDIQRKSNDLESVALSIPMGAGYESMTYRLKPLFKKSKFLVVTYPIPFDLNLERPPKGFPAPVVSKDNADRDESRELQGDVLRAATAWSQSYLGGGGGWTSDIVSVAGNIRWKRAVFDTTGAPWEQVVKALQSNAERSDEVTMIFERAEEGEGVDDS